MTTQRTSHGGIISSQKQDVVYNNTKNEILAVNKDRLKLILIDYEKANENRVKAWSSLAVFLSIIITIVTADFKDFLMSKFFWQAIFYLFAVGSFLFFIYSLYKSHKNKKDIEQVIKECQGN